MKRVFGIVLAVLVLSVMFESMGEAQVKPFTSDAKRSRIDDSLRVGNRSMLNGIIQSSPVTLAGAAGAQTLTAGTVFSLTGTTKQTSIVTSATDAGRIIILITASTDTLVDGSNLKLVGNFNGTADDVLMLVSDGTNWYEIGRNVN